jgi:protein tyrosine/serine phosphatase
MPRYCQYLFGTLIAAILVGGPFCFAWISQSRVRNLRVVRDGVLYRSGQMSIAGLKQVIYDYGIKTIVSLRDAQRPGDLPPDLAEEAYCEKEEINYCRISPRSWSSDNGNSPAATEGVRQFVAIMDRPENYPVLIHCFGGIHRSGAFSAIYRMEYEHWTNDRAIAELRACGYTTLDDDWDILEFLQNFHPRWQGPADLVHAPVPTSVNVKAVKASRPKGKHIEW